MTGRNGAVALLCVTMLLIFAYAFWIGARNTPALGGTIEASK